MAKTQKKKHYFQAVIFGMLSALSYVAVFLNQETVTSVTTRGGISATLPILAVFYFSFIHGAFASNILSILGIEAAKNEK